MTTAQKLKLIADADERRRRAERATLEIQIRLAIVREKLSVLETAEAKRQRKLIQSAVQRLIATGAVHRHNLYGQFNVLEQLVRDPSLVTLALTKRIYR